MMPTVPLLFRLVLSVILFRIGRALTQAAIRMAREVGRPAGGWQDGDR